MIERFLAEHAWLESALPVLIDAALKGAVLVLIAGVATYLLRNRSAAARHAVWTAAVIGHLAIPVFALVLPSWRIPLFPEAPWAHAVALPEASTLAGTTSPPAATPSVATPRIDAQPPGASQSAPTPVAPAPSVQSGEGSQAPGASRLSILAAIWLAGTILVLLRLAVGTWRVGQLARDGARVEDGTWLSLTQKLANRLGVSRPLTLLRGESLAVPVTWGIVYPAVLLPQDADTWPEERRRFVLVHEMAHVKRFDALTQLLAQFSLAIFWFSPLVWVASHRMRVEREHACDDYVLRDGTTPSLYAGELLEMVRSIGTSRHDQAAPAFAALAMARRSEFEGRMLAILDPRLDRHNLDRRGTFMTAAALALLILPLAALRPFSQAQSATATADAADGATTAKQIHAGAAIVADPGRVNVVKADTGTLPATTSAASGAAGAAVKSTGSSEASCERFLSVSGNSVHVTTGTNNHRESVKFVTSSNGRCTEASLLGRARFSPDETELTYLEPGGVARFREVVPGRDWTVVVVAGDASPLKYSAAQNGRSVPFDAEMKGWLSRLLPRVLREAGINVPARVARLREQGGVEAVLRDIGEIRSTGAKRSHYEELLKTTPLRANEASSVVSQAGVDLAPSSGDLSSVLQKLPRGIVRDAAARQAMSEALARIKSSGDKANTLQILARDADPETLLMLARAAEDLPSSGDKANYLITTASEYLTPRDDALRNAFFRTAATLPSSGDLANVLVNAMSYGHASPGVVMQVITTSSELKSSGDAAMVLRSLATQRLLTPQNPAATLAVIQRTLTMASSGDRALVLSTLARQGLLTTSAIRDAYTGAAMALPSQGDRAHVLDAAALRDPIRRVQ